MTQLKQIQTRKTRREIIEEEAYMVLSDIAFGFEEINGKVFLAAMNLKNLQQKAFFAIRKEDFMYMKGNMSKQNTYKTMLIVEKNKAMLMGGIKNAKIYKR